MTTDPPKRSWLRTVILVGPVLALTWLAVSLATTGFSGSFKRRDCPSHEDSLPSLALAGEITNVPEFHDCQRFIRDDGNAYEGLYGIFISQVAERLWDSLRLLECNAIPVQGGNARQDSIAIPVLLQGDGNCPDDQRQLVGVAFAQIESFDKPYPALGVKKGSNCLYLGRTPNPVAVVVPEVDDRQCLRTRSLRPPLPNGTVLQVHRQVASGYAPGDYPAVARWDREPHGAGRYLAGVVCGAGWCDAGPTDFTQAAARGYPNPGGMPAATTRTLAIKGWYDEQHLATTNWWGKLVPSTMVGVAYPAAGIDAVDSGAFLANWVLTAQVALIGGDQKVKDRYKELYNFDPVAIGAKANSYFLCRGTSTQCNVPSPTPVCANSSDPWWGRIDPAGGGRPQYRCEVRMVHEAGNIPRAVVRWRWLKDDEDLWKRCASGCCQPT